MKRDSVLKDPLIKYNKIRLRLPLEINPDINPVLSILGRVIYRNIITPLHFLSLGVPRL